MSSAAGALPHFPTPIYRVVSDSTSRQTDSDISGREQMDHLTRRTSGKTSSMGVHQSVAKRIVNYDYDLLLCFGEDSIYFADEAHRAGKEAYYFDDRKAFNRKIVDSIRPGDIILFKGGTRLHFKEETIYPIFGTII